MTTRTKTAGKTATTKTKNKKLSTLLSWFEESNAKWQQSGASLMFSDEELNLVTECKVKAYSGEYGNFVKLYVSLTIEGKTMTLKGDEDNEGKRRSGIKLDITSTKRLDLEEGEEVEIDPEKCVFYDLENKEDNTIVRRVRILR